MKGFEKSANAKTGAEDKSFISESKAVCCSLFQMKGGISGSILSHLLGFYLLFFFGMFFKSECKGLAI